MQTLLIAKPDNVTEYAAEYFKMAAAQSRIGSAVNRPN